ncbi:MAG: hypothetical protein FJW30_04840 [Acidobacteria bacterium]|nr:hypothetical protein [Acidobacteriota bacterium]
MVLTTQELIQSLRNEIRILVHLCGKAAPEMLDYRPTPAQRSLIELVRYLTIMGPVLVPSVKAGSFLVDQWNAAETASKSLDFDAAVKSLASQAEFYASALSAFTVEEMRGEIELFGTKASRGQHLVSMVLCGHAAYRTQLFCYLKAAGRPELNTMNLWAGVDGAM